MSPVIPDLPPFPARYGDDRCLHASLRLLLWSGREVVGILFELTESEITLDLNADQKECFELNDVKLAWFSEAVQGVSPDAIPQNGNVRFRDGSLWLGNILYYLRDRFGLHALVRLGNDSYRFFFPAASVKEYVLGVRLGEVLTTSNRISRTELDQALALQEKAVSQTPGIRPPLLGEILVEQGSLSEEELQQAVAERLGLEYVHLRGQQGNWEALSLIPENIARQYKFLPLEKMSRSLVVAMVDATDSDSLNIIGFLTGLTPDPVITTSEDLNWALDNFYSTDENTANAQAAERDYDAEGIEETRKLGSDRPIVRLVNKILAQAIHRGTSDIHLRPSEETIDLLFRIDGTMVFVKQFKKALLPAIVSRIKIMGNMDISERRLPQDGQTRVVDEGAVIDMRISVIPTINGESVVIRILNTKFGPLSIEQLGLAPDQRESLESHLEKSHGLILVTGPTGSGKSTTLYAALEVLRQKNLSVITVENPVEFHIPGIDQVQINEQAGLTFARVLRNILRHDPEVIMIGEIRDQETARIAVQSSLTGHLVLSTLHTNSAIGAVSRLSDMGIENYLLGPTLLCSLAQRLLKKNCPQCLAPEQVEPIWRRQLQLTDDETFFVGTGCDYCDGRGLKGRVGVYELLNVSESIAHAITAGCLEADLHKLAAADNMSTLVENGLALARKGAISLSQVYSIATDL